MAARSIISLNLAALVQGPVMTARPALATDGIDVTSWRTNQQFSAGMAAVFLSAGVAAALTSISGSAGVELWGYVAAPFSQWFLAGYLHDGVEIDLLGASQGFMQQLEILGSFSRLAVAAAVSAGAPVATFVPVEAYQ